MTMENNNDIIELLDILYSMVNDAWNVPLGNDKCIIEREKAIEIINDIKSNLPSSIAESKRLVSARDEFIGNAKREAEALLRNAQEQSAKLVDEQEVLKIAKTKAIEIVTSAQKQSDDLKKAATSYVDNLMLNVEKTLSDSLNTVRTTQNAFKSSMLFDDNMIEKETVSSVSGNSTEKIEDVTETTTEPVVERPKQTGNVDKKVIKVQQPKKRPQIIDIEDEDNWVTK